MSTDQQSILKSAMAVIQDLGGCYTVEEADKHVEQFRGYVRAITEHGLVPMESRSQLEGEIIAARRAWSSVRAVTKMRDELREVSEAINELPTAATERDLFTSILGVKKQIGYLQNEGALSVADSENLRTRVHAAATEAGKRLGIADPIKALQEQEPPSTVVTVREMRSLLETVPDSYQDLPLVSEDQTFYFDCSNDWTLTTRNRRTHSFTSGDDPEQVILI